MLFNSFFYILVFLPLVFTIYFTLASHNHKIAKFFLVMASFLFYGWWNPVYLKLLTASILANYSFAQLIQSHTNNNIRKYSLVAGICFNVTLLAYFKYANFFVENTNFLLHAHHKIKEIVLPLGISFFTFTQIAFLVDTYKRLTDKYGLINYALFVSYFPHLLAGPIIHHAHVMPQFNDNKNTSVNAKNVYLGIMLFVIGLTKKVVIADTFAIFANQGYSHVNELQFTSAWITSLAYTFQLYFDFSGYTDMAIGVSKMLNINLPINFNSPYKAINIQDFWRRWHVTLSNFLRDYIYIPLGGNRAHNLKIYSNLLTTFLIGGFWHGAGWTFIIWGFLHGLALCVQRVFGKLNMSIPTFLAWLTTFIFVNFAWVFFRSTSIHDAITIISCMFNFPSVTAVNPLQILMVLIALMLVRFTPNSNEISVSVLTQKLIFVPVISVLFLLSIFSMEISNSHEFIYFQF